MITERICYSIAVISEAITVWFYLEYLLQRKRNNWVAYLSFVLGYCILFFISNMNNTTVNAVAYSIINFFLIRCIYRCIWKMALLHTFFLCFAMVSSEVLVVLIFQIFGYEFSSYTYETIVLFTQVLLSKLMYLVISIVGVRVFSPSRQIKEVPHIIFCFCTLPVFSSCISVFVVYLGLRFGVTMESGIMMLVTILTLLTVNLIFFALYNYIERTNEEYLALQLSIQKEQADITYYEALQKQFESQQIIVHDIKKHLSAIDALAKQRDTNKIEEYISELGSAFPHLNQAKVCTDPILNLLLLRFRDSCSEVGVHFQCDIRTNISLFMDASSITTLYGNLLSNALESAEKSRKRQIELSVSWNDLHSVIILAVVNSCDAAPVPDGNGGFFTRKNEKDFHGIGLRSISRVVKKYNGIATMYYEKNTMQFHHIIQFPAIEPNYGKKFDL